MVLEDSYSISALCQARQHLSAPDLTKNGRKKSLPATGLSFARIR